MTITYPREDGVSFCIPNWNHRSYLPRSVGSAVKTISALKASGFAGEIIIVDDASRDGSQRATAALAAGRADVTVDVVLAPVNRGLAASRMVATDRARFRWVCFLDADNELLPQNFIDLWRAARETQAAIVYGNLVVKQRGQPIRLLSNDAIQPAILKENYVDAFCIMDKMALIQIEGYKSELNTHEDWELLLHMISEGQDIVFVPIVMGIYHVEAASMVQTVPVDHTRFHRIFNQRGIGLPRAFRPHRMYHPSLGWL